MMIISLWRPTKKRFKLCHEKEKTKKISKEKEQLLSCNLDSVTHNPIKLLLYGNVITCTYRLI
jgi:hypothetical protein